MDKYEIGSYQQLPIVLPISRFHDLPKLFRELGFKKGVEIGVQRGRYSKWLCATIPGLELFCVDPWEVYDEYVEQHTEDQIPVMNEFMEHAKERLAPYNATLIKKYSMDAVKDFEDESLDFCFIDGNHSFEYVVDDIAAWSKKIKKGGIIAGHDYWNSADGHYWAGIENATEYEKRRLCQVKDAVDAWTKTEGISPWFVLKGDKCPSWFFIKE